MIVVNYVYDAWGNHKVLDVDGVEIEDKSHIGHLNPIRYRSYYYDADFGFYFLNTRYYDPKIGRFINADDTQYLNPDIVNGLNLYAYCGNNPVMNVDPNGTDWWQWALGILTVGAIAIFTAGVAGGVALAVGATIATGKAVMVGATIGGLIAGGTNLVTQGITTNWQTVDYASLALSTFVGGSSGAISSGFGQLSAGILSKTQLLAHKGFQIAGNLILSWGGYVFSSAASGKEVTLDGIIFSTLGGFMSGVAFNWGTSSALGLIIGLEFTGYIRDIAQYFRKNLNNTQRVN